LLVATPLNSSISMATVAATRKVIVTVVADLALAAYHSPPSEAWPPWKKPWPRTHVLPAESVTWLIWWDFPAYRPATRTRRSPAGVGAARLAIGSVDFTGPEAPTAWNRAG